jgi:hypothetical protein
VFVGVCVAAVFAVAVLHGAALAGLHIAAVLAVCVLHVAALVGLHAAVLACVSWQLLLHCLVLLLPLLLPRLGPLLTVSHR